MPVKEMDKKGDTRFQPGHPGGPGRPRGSKNKVSSQVVADLMSAYKDLGGIEWLKKIAEAEPGLFVAMWRRLIPTKAEVEVESSGDLTVAMREMTDEELERLAHATGLEGLAEAVDAGILANDDADDGDDDGDTAEGDGE